MRKQPLFAKITTFMQKHALMPKEKSTVIVGLSGGPDSVFLLYFLHDLAKKHHFSLMAAHLDHQWRPDSADDTQFCKHISEHLKIPFETTTLDQLTIIKKPSGSKEDLGRVARRIFFNELAQRYQAEYIALAHHTQDQQENFFIRLIRGTTLDGLIGMRPQEGNIVRPLLGINKQEIIDYLTEHTIAYRIDPSNELPTFLRNKVRPIVEELRTVDERFDSNFERTLKHLQEAHNFIESIVQRTLAEIITTDSVLDLNHWRKLSSFFKQKVIVAWLIVHQVSFELREQFIDEIVRFLSHERGGVHQLNPLWSIVKKENKAFIQHHRT